MAMYKLLDGKHQQDRPVKDADGNPKKDPDGKELREPVTYKKGDVFESDSDLLKLNQPGAIKFQLADDPRGREGRIASGKGPNDPEPKQSNKAPGGQVSQGAQYTSGTEVNAGPSGNVGRDFPMPAQDFLPKPELAPELVDPSAEGEGGDTVEGGSKEGRQRRTTVGTPARTGTPVRPGVARPGVHSGVRTTAGPATSHGTPAGTGLPQAGGPEAGKATENPANKDMK